MSGPPLPEWMRRALLEPNQSGCPRSLCLERESKSSGQELPPAPSAGPPEVLASLTGLRAGRWGEGAPRKSLVEPGSRRRAGTGPWCAARRAHRRPFPARAVGRAPRWAPHRRRPSVGTEGASACACVCAPAGPQLLRRLRQAASCAAPLLPALLGGKGDSSPDLYRGSWLPCDLTRH